MSTEHHHNSDENAVRAAALRQAARIAASEATPLAPELWNLACEQIARRLAEQATSLEAAPASPAVSPLAPSSRLGSQNHCCRSSRLRLPRRLGR